MIMKAQKQIREIQMEVEQKIDVSEFCDLKVKVGKRKNVDRGKSVPLKKRKVVTRSSLVEISIKSEPISAKHTKETSVSLEKKQEIADEDLKLAQFFSFSCQDCPALTFAKFASYKRHMRQTHKIARPVIICCKQRYGKRCRLVEHMSYHLNPNKFKCPECNRQFTAKDRIDNHRKQMHGPKDQLNHECDKCGRRFRALAGLRAHLFSHLSKAEKDTMKVHICDECGSKFISKFLLVQHMRHVHIKPNPYVCDICAKIYKSKTQFLYHHNTVHRETPEPKVKCKICDRLCLNELCLKAHMKTVHTDDGPHICDICKKESPTSRALKSHKLYVHESVRKFQCTFCEKAFKKEVELKEHMAVHLGGALYLCQFCEKTFNSGANMYSHRKKMHPEEHEKLQEVKRGK